MPPQGRQCKLDYDNFSNNLQQRCEEAGGQHTLSYYMVTCDGASYSLQLAVNAEPGCVATVCRADDTKTLLKLHATARVIARLEGGGNFKCTLSHFRNRQPTALFDKRIAIQTNPPTTPTYAPVQTKKPSTYAPYIPPSTDVPKPEGPTVKVTSSGGICSYKLNMLLAAVVATLFFFLFWGRSLPRIVCVCPRWKIKIKLKRTPRSLVRPMSLNFYLGYSLDSSTLQIGIFWHYCMPTLCLSRGSCPQ